MTLHQRFSVFWQQRQQREKILLVMMAALLAVSGLYYLLYRPAVERQVRYAEAAAKARSDLGEIYSLVASGQMGQTALPRDDKPLDINALQQSWVTLWKHYEITALPATVKGDTLEARFEAASYPRLMTGLSDLVKLIDLEVVTLRLETSERLPPPAPASARPSADMVSVVMTVAVVKR